MHKTTLTKLLRLDGAANLVGGMAVITAGNWLAGPLGLASAWPLWLVGIVFLATSGTSSSLAGRQREV